MVVDDIVGDLRSGCGFGSGRRGERSHFKRTGGICNRFAWNDVTLPDIFPDKAVLTQDMSFPLARD
jgi:hypothetical protein